MIIILDTETAGFGKEHPVLQIAYQAFHPNGELFDEYSAYLNHRFDYEIDDGAFNVHGLTKEFLSTACEPSSEIFHVQRMIDQCELFVAHNVAFDWRMLRQDIRRYPQIPDMLPAKPINSICTQNNPRIKAFVDAKDVNGRLKSPNLGELYTKLFGAEIEGAHNALSDVRATARCYFELKRRGIVQ